MLISTFSRDVLTTVLFQIKNLVTTARALATQEAGQLTMSQLEVAIEACEGFDSDFNGAGPVGVSVFLALSWLTKYPNRFGCE